MNKVDLKTKKKQINSLVYFKSIEHFTFCYLVKLVPKNFTKKF